MSKQGNDQSTGEKMIEYFTRDVPETDREPDNEGHDLLEGTSRETAYLDENGMLVVHYWSQKDFVVGDGWAHLMPGDTDFDELCKKHGLKKPGDSNQILMHWLDGKWVTVLPDQNPDTGKAKTA
jgi:hypothetical protein